MRRSSILLFPFLAIHILVLANDRLAADPAPQSTVVDEPYLVFVAEEAAHLRCGPSGEYYRTDPLRHGQELEVYVETGDGWMGVRPTEDSFCWVPADTVKLRNNRDADSRGVIKPRTGTASSQVIEAEVIENKTVAWIGTNLGRARRYRWQVQLGEGEVVTILGSSERDGPDGPQTWYRIVPPSGEFRWIHQDQVVTTAEELIASVKPNTTDETLQFLPDGPSVVADQKDKPSSATSFNRQLAENEVWKDDRSVPRKLSSRSQRDDDQTINQIEANIEARQRSLAVQPEATDSIVQTPEATSQADGHDNHPRSFSERVTSGLSVLMRGRSPRTAELEPITESSRRVPDLVPIGSGLVQNELPPTPMVDSQDSVEPRISIPVLPSVTEATVESPQLVAASSQPGLLSNQSQIAFLSPPRMVTPASVPIADNTTPASLSNSGSLAGLPPAPINIQNNSPPAIAPGRYLPPQKVRTIQAEQLESVRQSVASASSDSLPMELSKLMARGASSPEIALVAEAATKFGNRELAVRARDYQSLARRRDGDTVVAPLRDASSNGGFVSRGTMSASAPLIPNSNREDSTIARTSFVPSGNQPVVTASSTDQTVQSGILVEVYSADPSRPPYAITDAGGRTLAYVTPAPGVDVKVHLGSQIRLSGESGYLQGLETPHILATSAERLLR